MVTGTPTTGSPPTSSCRYVIPCRPRDAVSSGSRTRGRSGSFLTSIPSAWPTGYWRRSPICADRREPAGHLLGSLGRGLVERERERLGIGDVDEVAHLHALEVLRILHLDRLGVALGALDGHGLGFLVDGLDGGRDRNLARDGPGRSLAWLRGLPLFLDAHPR